MTAPTSRAPITCHVLDTTTGLPAPGLSVTLSFLHIYSSSSSATTATVSSSSTPISPTPPTSSIFTATTDNDGRISAWGGGTDADGAVADALETLFALGRDDGKTLVWSLRFATGVYYGEGKTFWPEVEVKFWTGRGRDHVHVPLLLGPYGYTTYRGS